MSIVWTFLPIRCVPKLTRPCEHILPENVDGKQTSFQEILANHCTRLTAAAGGGGGFVLPDYFTEDHSSLDQVP